jgi:hypothetical protein
LNKVITRMSDFSDELKESETLEVCRTAGIITSDVYKILHQKLGIRNSAAHPSDIVIKQLQVEEFIDNLITNVVKRLV